MPVGFKIADGYVEVHADYNKQQLRREAQKAADDFGTDFSRRSRANFKKSGMAAAGQQFGRELVRGATVGAAKEAPTIVTETVTVVEKEVHSSRSRSRLRKVGVSIADHIRAGLLGPGGAPRAAQGFVRNFVEAVTFGQADFGRINTTGLARGFATLGTGLGAGLAVALLAELGNAITAGLPLLLGAGFAAIPFFTLIRSGLEKEKGKWKILNNEMGKQLQKVVDTWKVFKTEISKPWKPVVMATLEGLRGLMEDLEKPLTRIGKAIAPAFGKLMQGVFDSIESFVKALEPAMPGIVAGLEAWAKELPRIATAIGDMIAYILKDPKQVADAVKNFSDFLILVSKIVGPVVSGLTKLTDKLHGLTSAIMIGANLGLLLQKGWANVKPVIDEVVGWFKELPGRIKAAIAGIKIDPWNVDYDKINKSIADWILSVMAKLDGLSRKVIDWSKSMWGGVADETAAGTVGVDTETKKLTDKIIQYFKDMDFDVVEEVKSMWADITDSWTVNSTVVGTKHQEFTDERVVETKGMGTKIVDAVKKMWADTGNSFTASQTGIGASANIWVTKIKGFFSDMKTKVVDTVKRMWTDAKTSFTQNHTSIAADVTRWKDRIIGFFTNLKTRVVAEVKRLWADAKSSFLRTSGEILADVNRWKDRVVGAFRTAVANIRTIWNGVKSAVSGPITWIKDNVYNKPLVPVWNRVAGLVSGPKLSAYAEGGEIRGPRHGRDNVLGVSANGTATARVEPGEWIAPRWMSSLFPQLEGIRKRGRAALQEVGDPKGLPGFADGGVVGWMKGLASSVSSKVGDLKDWVLGGLRDAAGKVLNPVKALINQAMPKSGVGTTVGGIGKKLIDLILDKIKSDETAAYYTGPTGTGAGPGSAVATGGWASVYKALRSAGARSFTTYAGHDQGASRSRDVWPPRESIFQMARRLSSIWYTIYNRRIASTTYGMRIRPYTRSNPHTDHVHVTLRPGVAAKLGGGIPTFDRGGILPPGLSLAYNGTGRPEAVLPQAALTHASATGQLHGRAFNPTINVNISAGLDPIDAGARRALVKALWLELDSYEKDYMRR